MHGLSPRRPVLDADLVEGAPEKQAERDPRKGEGEGHVKRRPEREMQRDAVTVRGTRKEHRQ